MRTVAAAVIEVHGMIAIEVSARGYEVGVTIPDRAGVVRGV